MMSWNVATRPRALRFESLEDRRMLTARATDAVNLFAYDVYENLQREQGNLFFSPLSIATGLAMAYAGAAGQTAAEMEQVLHLGTEPGIHTSFNALLTALEANNNFLENLYLTVANAVWPQAGFPVHSSYLNTLVNDYQGYVQSLDYSNPEMAEDIINAWVEQQTYGKIQDLVDGLSPATAMVLTNSVYFKGLWKYQFDPIRTGTGSFSLGDGQSVQTPMMYTQPYGSFTTINGSQILELGFADGSSQFSDSTASIIFILPQQGGANEVTTDLLTEIDDWLESSPPIDFLDLYLPKFQTTVSTDFKQLLMGLGMPTAFSSGGADFSAMTAASVWIDKVFHKATIEVNEQGTEAAAATEVEILLCFAAGTPVLTPEGEKPIEQIQAGDHVLARDEYNLEGGLEPKLVERTLHGHAEILELHVGGQIIRTTAPHPFFAYKKGWTPASELQPGDRLSTNLFDWVTIDEVVETNEAEPVYNLRVADHRTYFIGSESWGFAVWAHNSYGSEFIANRPFHFLIRDNTTSTITFMGRIEDPTQLQNDLNPSVQVVNADFDGDQDVDGRDFLAWQRGFGITTGAQRANGDSNGDGDVDSNDLAEWADTYGQVTNVLLVTESASGPKSLSTDELIGAAMAWEWFGGKDAEIESPVKDRAASFDAFFAASGAIEHDASRLAASDIHELDVLDESGEDAADNNDSWLFDELLERVFE